MAIITTAKAKTLLQISDSTYDTVIAALIPIIQNWVVEYCRNPFHVEDIYIDASTIAFVDSDPDTITDSGSGFVTAGFTDAIDIHVENSKDNDGIYSVDTVAAGTLTLSSAEELNAESADNQIRITKVKFPKALELPVARMIGYDIQKANMNGISDQSLGDYRIKYRGGGDKDGGYPKGLLLDLESFRKLYKTMPSKNNDDEVGGN